MRKNKNKATFLTLVCIAIIALSLTALMFTTLAPVSSFTDTNVAGSETQFKVDISYAYVGNYSGSYASYKEEGKTMSLVTQYPTVAVLNITGRSGVQIKSCDAVVEVYGVNFTTDKGVQENHAYIIGTNYSSAFSAEKNLSSLVNRAIDLVDKSIYITTDGHFEYNWTNNKSVLSHRVGSIGTYSTLTSSRGLWSANKPQQISVSVTRIGYVTWNNNQITVYTDLTPNTKDNVQLSDYQDGLIYNHLIPTNKLSPEKVYSPTAETATK